jgi:hypothetical protein
MEGKYGPPCADMHVTYQCLTALDSDPLILKFTKNWTRSVGHMHVNSFMCLQVAFIASIFMKPTITQISMKISFSEI